ncbi:MAG: four-helix bundle copper-binding protein [Phycisphaerales bacterium]
MSCVNTCFECAAACFRCVNLTYANRETHDEPFPGTCIECAAICTTAGKVLAIDGAFASDVAAICADVCEWCAEQSERHGNPQCRELAGPARACAGACRAYDH